jgi:hypothetical protein
MFGWFKKETNLKRQRSMVGDLDLLTKKEFFVRYQNKEWRIPELTAREYAEFCALLVQLEDKTAAKDPEKVDEIYQDIFGLTVPALPARVVRKMSLADSHALFVTILKHYGFDLSDKPSDKKKVGPAKSQTT